MTLGRRPIRNLQPESGERRRSKAATAFLPAGDRGRLWRTAFEGLTPLDKISGKDASKERWGLLENDSEVSG